MKKPKGGNSILKMNEHRSLPQESQAGFDSGVEIMMTHSSTRTRVVIVDDSRTMQAVLDHLLSAMRQFEVVGIAADGETAIDLIRRVKPDLVTIDLLMPYIDGTQLLEAISDQPELRKVVISANAVSSLPIVTKLESLGADAIVSKAEISRDPNILTRVLSTVMRKPKPATRVESKGMILPPMGGGYPMPVDEKQRLSIIERLSLANDRQDYALDLITAHLSNITNYPSCIITFIDREKQWIKSGFAFERSSMDRSQAICNHTICGDEPFIVKDTATDSRFSSLEVVRSGSIRSYVGFPIITSRDIKIGAICLLDTKPRNVSLTDLRNIRSVAKLAATIIEERGVPSILAA